MIKPKLLLLATVFMISMHAFSQQPDTATEAHQHHHEKPDQHSNEFGIANSVVYFTGEKSFSYGLHMHYSYSIPKTKFGVGLGYERVFDTHKHQTIGLVGTFQPIDRLNLNLSPGITFEGGNMADPAFALHVESSYEFEINHFHLGPTIEFAYDPEDYHISVGLHLGFGF